MYSFLKEIKINYAIVSVIKENNLNIVFIQIYIQVKSKFFIFLLYLNVCKFLLKSHSRVMLGSIKIRILD